MASFLIHHAKHQSGDILIEDDDITLTLHHGWATFSNSLSEVALAVPADQVSYIERVPPPGDGQARDQTTADGPAPKE